MRSICFSVLMLLVLGFSKTAWAQTTWPKSITTESGVKITIYQPVPESLKNNQLKSRAAVSIQATKNADLIFGAIWSDASVLTDRTTRMVSLEKITITDVRFPDVTDTVKVGKFKKILETEIPKWKLTMSLDVLVATIEENQPAGDDKLNTDAPVIVYRKQASVLVFIDGEPKLVKDETSGLQKVTNTPFLIVQEGASYYLYGGMCWYRSASITEGWALVTELPTGITELNKQLLLRETADEKEARLSHTGAAPAVVITKVPAELVQTSGDAAMKPIEGTQLLYVSNTDNDLFMDITSQQYFVLLSGRWYSSKSLSGTWTYIPASQLPADFKRIPEGSEKDAVLASVPGTQAAKEAVMDAQVPQTAKVDRATATCTVVYDGDPVFEKIEGTSLMIAKNTSATVIQSGTEYYCVQNGIWFLAKSATGPWAVSDTRPKDIDNIPASSSAYNVKYVYIYEATPQVVYVGYTPGYTGCYVYGSTVVYGTGYYYNPWYGVYYYPRPVTYGFSMHYNPYYGWGMSYTYSTGFFHYTAVVHPHYGYWGPPMYHPPYHPPYHGGYYGRQPVQINNTVNINRNNNVYAGNKGVQTNDIKRSGSGNRPSTQPAGRQNVYTDQSGNAYRQNKDGNWQQRNNTSNQWQQGSGDRQKVDNQQRNASRAQNRDAGFNNNRGTGAGRTGGNAGGGRGGRR